MTTRPLLLLRGLRLGSLKREDAAGQVVKGLQIPDRLEVLARQDRRKPQLLGLRLSVNGRKRQDGSTANMIFGVGYLIWYLSQYMVLEPGDLIDTGTPAGVALGLPDHPYLRDGDRVQLEIDGLGQAEQRFVNAD